MVGLDAAIKSVPFGLHTGGDVKIKSTELSRSPRKASRQSPNIVFAVTATIYSS
jgi:hypothetical protein